MIRFPLLSASVLRRRDGPSMICPVHKVDQGTVKALFCASVSCSCGQLPSEYNSDIALPSCTLSMVSPAIEYSKRQRRATSGQGGAEAVRRQVICVSLMFCVSALFLPYEVCSAVHAACTFEHLKERAVSERHQCTHSVRFLHTQCVCYARCKDTRYRTLVHGWFCGKRHCAGHETEGQV